MASKYGDWQVQRYGSGQGKMLSKPVWQELSPRPALQPLPQKWPARPSDVDVGEGACKGRACKALSCLSEAAVPFGQHPQAAV